MSKSKDKGRRFEHEIADTLTNAGIIAKRVPMSGMLRQLGDEFDGDVRIQSTQDKIECKYRETISKSLWDWLDGNQYLAVKRNHKKPLIVMPIETFIMLLQLNCIEKDTK